MFKKRKITIRHFAYYLLIVSIVLSCVTNGIFAKFTTEDDGGDGARVAKFGIILSVAGDLFSTVYSGYSAEESEDADGNPIMVEKAGSNNPTVITADENTITVKSKVDLNDNVIAPGTKNDVGICIDIEGVAETDCEITYDYYLNTIHLKSEGPRSLGLMIPIGSDVINESNFDTFIDNGVYTEKDVKDTDGNILYQDYTKVKSNNTFDENEIYYKLIGGFDSFDIYTPITYKLNGDVLIGPKIGNIGNAPYTAIYYSDYFNNYTETLKREFTNINRDVRFYGIHKILEAGAEIDDELNFTWEWPYHQSGASLDDSAVEKCDYSDTILGYLAAGKNVVKCTKNNSISTVYSNNLIEGTDYNLEVEFTAEITVTQID